jgi:hypothetical protein
MPLRVLSSPLPRRTQETKQPPVRRPDSFALKYDSSDVINHAQSSLDKFDVMFPQGGTELVTNAQAETDDDSSQRSQGPSRDYEFESVASFSQEAGSFAPGEEETDASISTIHRASQPDSTFEQGEQSMANWFISVFGLASGSSDDLFQYLGLHDLELSSSLGFSRLKNYRFREKLQLRYNSKLERAISILDRTTPLNTFKFALLYSGHRHESSEEDKAETMLLETMHCSPAFHKFASQLGTMTHTRHLKYYSAGLDASEFESDGKYTIAWSPQESTSTVVFHVIHLLSEGINNRKRHIGNDNVLILFVDKSSDIDLEINSKGDFTRGSSIVSGHFNFATILVTVIPQPGLFRVSCRIRSNIPDELSRVLSDFAGEELISEVHVADYVRGLAMRIDLACRTLVDDGLPPATNTLERCRQIAELNRYVM